MHMNEDQAVDYYLQMIDTKMKEQHGKNSTIYFFIFCMILIVVLRDFSMFSSFLWWKAIIYFFFVGYIALLLAIPLYYIKYLLLKSYQIILLCE